jgi:diguanylate cyclase (GGDEF)-like protein
MAPLARIQCTAALVSRPPEKAMPTRWPAGRVCRMVACVFDRHDRLLLANERYLRLWDLPAALGRPGTPYNVIAAATRGREVERPGSGMAPPDAPPGTRRREWLMNDGRHIEVVVTRLADGSCVAVHEDISERRRAEAAIAHLARHDPLTALPNRSVLHETLRRSLPGDGAGAALPPDEVALLWLDLDRFKEVNDTLGHPAGDTLLQQVAQRLRECVRGDDLVVRLGGDEFALLQRCGAQPASATALARRLVAALSQPFSIDGRAVRIGTSVGIALAPFDGTTPGALLKSADLALYAAKGAGRGTFRFFEPAMDESAQQRRLLQDELRAALALQQLRLDYQPQVNADTGAVTGVEALLRWEHPRRGRVSPADFVPLAEQTGLIVPIGRWVLSQACRDAMDWPDSVRVSVNVSAVQFRQGGLLRDVAAALADSGLAPQRLELEITETVMMADTDTDAAVAQLEELRVSGVRVAMDDFGTGYSSLSHLRRFPFDRLKIDRSFVRDVACDPHAQSIVRAIQALGHSLGMCTTVEGVETAEQLAMVRAQGCTEVQGYLFARPQPAAAVAAWIAGNGLGPTLAAPGAASAAAPVDPEPGPGAPPTP